MSIASIVFTGIFSALACLIGLRLGAKWERQKIFEYIHHRGQYDLGSFKVIDIGMEIEQCCHHKGHPVPDLLKERCDRERSETTPSESI
jgi:hypothetical protein